MTARPIRAATQKPLPQVLSGVSECVSLLVSPWVCMCACMCVFVRWCARGARLRVSDCDKDGGRVPARADACVWCTSQVLSGLLQDMQQLHERFDQIEGDILGPDKISSSRAPQPALTVALIGPCSPLSVVML